ncbi:MAG: MMPL family transporter [Acidobacteria bacterium]|nr:MMPL family transporter [Acidobacteriota bacterium]
MQPRNLAARAGRWSATHRKTAILGWILFVVLAREGPRPLHRQAGGTSKGESCVWNAILTRVCPPGRLGAARGRPARCALDPGPGHAVQGGRHGGLSRSQPIVQTLDRIDAAFPGGSLPASVVVKAPASVVVKAKDVTAPEVQTAIKQLHDKAIATGGLSEPSSVTVNPDKTVAMVTLSIKGKGTDAASERSLEVLRDDVVPATVGKLQNAEVAVGGMTAWSKDFIDTMKSHLPVVFGFVLAMACILLLVTFRSIVVPIKAIILNLLSVGSAYGVLTLVFQDGHGEKALGFTSVGGITPWLPLFLFVVLFTDRQSGTKAIPGARRGQIPPSAIIGRFTDLAIPVSRGSRLSHPSAR